MTMIIKINDINSSNYYFGNKAIGDFVSIWEHGHNRYTWLAMDGQKHRGGSGYPKMAEHGKWLGLSQRSHGKYLYPWIAFDLGRPQRVTEVNRKPSESLWLSI